MAKISKLRLPALLLLLGLFFSSEQVCSFTLERTNAQYRKSASKRFAGEDAPSFSTSAEFAIDLNSEKAKEIMSHLGLTDLQHKQLSALSVLVVDWNEKINLISRRDCCKEVVFGRHIIPSLAPLGLKDDPIIKDNQRVVDVGTGGGFPGLPLAIAYPNVEFLLVDSVGKKLAAVEDMAKTLKLENVKVHHGRAEILQEKDFDVCVGRSVAAIPTYCFWVNKLLKKKNGKLAYLIGGEIDDYILDQSIFDRDVDDLLDCPGASDKRLLVFPYSSVKEIARTSGEKIRVPVPKKQLLGKKKKKRAKGEWAKRDNTAPKQRGYEGFQRFDSLNQNAD